MVIMKMSNALVEKRIPKDYDISNEELWNIMKHNICVRKLKRKPGNYKKSIIELIYNSKDKVSGFRYYDF